MHYDAIIIGGSFAGLSAAMYLARARKSVCVLDTGEPRNRFAAASHGLFAQDGSDPKLMLDTMRQQVGAYPTVRFFNDAAVEAQKADGSFSVTLQSGATIAGKRLLLAFGVSDILPEMPGLAERWGASVIHCPYCHGYEFSDRLLGVLNVSPMSYHQAMLIADWGPATFYLDGGELEAAASEALSRRGVRIEPARVEHVTGDGSNLSAIHLSDGSTQPIDALFISPRNRLNSEIAGTLGCDIDHGPLGSTVKVDQMQMTSVPDVYAAGDITRMAHNVTFACADGVMAAMAIHRSLVFGGDKQ
ncbi:MULTISPECIES: NAD(P)/FAD-dependent oxidoreductase [Hyphomicrobiales]|uniref:NAD(P)/FAD-dependent oxidoreductase n=1 Tax=Hyphomicrobiales TaxID=356 RepID=UPI000C19791A|nr:NAD(P)/FAD-dependent oxidoreductase [Pararhizobium haloflavum]HCF1766114.1 NAD(P)/FAD-dependent oxidoreductase [Pseudomonas aeruginosa]